MHQVTEGDERDGRNRPIPIEISMAFIKFDRWYLRSLHTSTEQNLETMDQDHIKQIPFQHGRNHNHYIAVQVNEFGITHIAF